MTTSLFLNPIFTEALSEIEALGVRVSARPQTGAIPYAIVGGRSNQRWWLIPLANRQVAVSGWAFFQPILVSTKILKYIAVAASRIGLSALWVREKVYLTGTPCVAELMGLSHGYCAYFTGTDSPHRKVAVQIMTEHGDIGGFAKVTKNETVGELLRHEAVTLGLLHTLAFQTAYVPKVVFGGQMNGVHLLVTDTLKTRRSKTKITIEKLHIDFLNELFDKTKSKLWVDETCFSQQLVMRYSTVAPRMSAAWQNRLEKSFEYISKNGQGILQPSLCHGDFTPWNTFIVNGGLYIFDWEYSDTIYPMGYDLIHFMLVQYIGKQWKQWKPEVVLSRILKKVQETWYPSNPLASKVALMCYLCGHTLHYAGRARGEPLAQDDWEGAERVASLFDELKIS
jgi:hypothetical protein